MEIRRTRTLVDRFAIIVCSFPKLPRNCETRCARARAFLIFLTSISVPPFYRRLSLFPLLSSQKLSSLL